MSEPWTYGSELEMADFDRRDPRCAALAFDLRDVTMVNNDGVAVDPRGKLYHLGGEVQTRPTMSASGQGEQLAALVDMGATVNYRSNLHVHVRVPGLRDDLELLLRVQRHIHRWMPGLLRVMERIPVPIPEDQPNLEALKGAKRRAARRRVSHQRCLNADRLKFQLQAVSTQDFFEREVRDPKTGRLNWAISPRLCVNLRQLLETDTVEFRHFPGTTSPNELRAAVIWCEAYLYHALEDDDPSSMTDWHPDFPRFQPYVHWMEVGFEATGLKHQTRSSIPAKIEWWLREGADEAKERYGCV